MKTLIGVLLFTLLGVAGCGSLGPPILVPEAQAVHPYGAVTLSSICKKPVELTRDCSYFSAGTRLISIGGTEIKIGGSADGKTVLLHLPDLQDISAAFRPPAVTNSETNLRFRIVKAHLETQGIHDLHVIPVTLPGTVTAYVVIYDGDAYSVLEAFTKGD